MKLPKFKRHHQKQELSLAEIHEYTLDLQRVTLLRDKCKDETERENYNTAINVMQKVLIYLNTLDVAE